MKTLMLVVAFVLCSLALAGEAQMESSRVKKGHPADNGWGSYFKEQCLLKMGRDANSVRRSVKEYAGVGYLSAGADYCFDLKDGSRCFCRGFLGGSQIDLKVSVDCHSDLQGLRACGAGLNSFW